MFILHIMVHVCTSGDQDRCICSSARLLSSQPLPCARYSSSSGFLLIRTAPHPASKDYNFHWFLLCYCFHFIVMFNTVSGIKWNISLLPFDRLVFSPLSKWKTLMLWQQSICIVKTESSSSWGSPFCGKSAALEFCWCLTMGDPRKSLLNEKRLQRL